MRKTARYILIFLVGFLVVFAACDNDNSPKEEDISFLQEDNDISVEETPLENEDVETHEEDLPLANSEEEVDFFGIPIDTDMQEEIVRLVEGNKKCVFEIYVIEPLPATSIDNIDNRYYKVDSNDFTTFSDLKEYTSSIFCESEVNRILFCKYPDGTEYSPFYLDLNNALFVDADLAFNTPYYSTWPDYSFEIISLTDDACEFKMHTTEDPPPEVGDPVPFVLDFKAIVEDGQWKLEKMVYKNESW